MKTMNSRTETDEAESRRRLTDAYREEKPRLLSRLRAAGRTWEEAEDLVQDVYAETLERLPLVSGVRNLPAWINWLLTRRVMDAWRKEKVRSALRVEVTEETLREIIAETGLDPLDSFVRESLTEALNDALRVLPAPQRTVLEAQVFGGLTFREIAESTGENMDTLMARKRYALANLARALRRWIED